MITRRKTNCEDKRHRFSVIIIILLAIVIIWLLLVNIFGFKDLVRTEKINILHLASCASCQKNPYVPETGDDESENDSSDGSKSKQYGDFLVYDKDITWGIFSDLRIFEDSLYDNRELIAPHSTNTYEYIVRNSTGVPISYTLDFEECNPDKINMKYRLIHGGRYLAGNETTWVTFDQLNQSAKTIENSTDDVYYLEWKWFDAENDTEIGEKDYSKYELKISVKAVQAL